MGRYCAATWALTFMVLELCGCCLFVGATRQGRGSRDIISVGHQLHAKEAGTRGLTADAYGGGPGAVSSGGGYGFGPGAGGNFGNDGSGYDQGAGKGGGIDGGGSSGYGIGMGQGGRYGPGGGAIGFGPGWSGGGGTGSGSHSGSSGGKGPYSDIVGVENDRGYKYAGHNRIGSESEYRSTKAKFEP